MIAQQSLNLALEQWQMIDDDSPNQICPQIIIGMYQVITRIDDFACRGYVYIGAYPKRSVHRLTDYRDFPLDGTSKAQIFTKRLKLTGT
ncbi:MAG: hypothetical protein NC342_05535 [Pseudoflavonifractor sp.]|nr:hypothetical protein [Pseudoflavonifractor sp.]